MDPLSIIVAAVIGAMVLVAVLDQKGTIPMLGI